jgi:hypothetical protein
VARARGGADTEATRSPSPRVPRAPLVGDSARIEAASASEAT